MSNDDQDAAGRRAAADAVAEAPPTHLDELDGGTQVLSLLKPVVLCMIIVVWLIDGIGATNVRGGFSSVMVYQEKSSDTVAVKAGGVALNSLALVALLAVVTTLLVVLYKFRCKLIIYGWLLFSVGSLLFVFGGFVMQQLLESNGMAIDKISFNLILYNIAATGTLAVFWTPIGCGPTPPKLLQQATLVFVSALLAWSATQLPEWSTWGVLAAVALWDIVAVLPEQGPLKLLVEEAERRNEPIPGLVYDGDDIKLGLGDFVFYSILVGRASMRNQTTLVACAVAVLTGLCATLSLLPIMQKALPALPISIALGIIAYFTTSYLVTPLVEAAATHNLFL